MELPSLAALRLALHDGEDGVKRFDALPADPMGNREVAEARLRQLIRKPGEEFANDLLDVISLEEATEPSENSDTIPHPEFIADWRQSPEQLVETREIKRLLDEALARLDEKHRMVFLLRDVEGLSIKETAEALDLSQSNTKMRLLRARLQLREQLTQTLGDPATQLVRTPHHQH